MSINYHKIGKLSKRLGDNAEEVAGYALNSAGFRMVEKIHTGWKIVKWIKRKSFIAKIVPHEKVSGDFQAIEPITGRRVLAEVKTGDSKNLAWSRLKDHQHESLKENLKCNGISIIIWIVDDDIHILDYEKLLSNGFGEITAKDRFGQARRRRSIDGKMASSSLYEENAY